MHTRLALALALTTLARAGTAHAAVTLDLASITAVEDESGWHLRADLEGSSDVASAALAPPAGAPLALACEASSGGTECEFESVEVESLAALLALYPSGAYQLSLNGGVRTASLPFEPIAPDGLVTVTSPADGAASVDPTPDLAWVQDCGNCVALLFAIEDVAAPANVGLERLVPSPAGSGTVTWGQLESFEGPKPPALPDGRYAIVASTAVGAQTTGRLTPGNDGFEYTQGALREVRTTFTVPEPGPASGLAALAALAVAARRRMGPGAARPCRRSSGR